MTRPASIPRLAPATPLRPATYAGVAAAIVSVVAAIVIRVSPGLEGVASTVHLALTVLFYATGGALAAKLGADGWRAGVFAGLLDALVGHAIAFFIAAPPDASRMSIPKGVEVTPELLGGMQLWGAVLGAVMAVLFGAAAGAVGGWYAKRAR